MTGILYLVATPIGNLEDITFRAIRILQEVDLIAAEDTRHTGKLLQHYQIKTPTISYHQHNHQTRITELSEKLLNGLNIALVSDAGTPVISDPGYHLVLSCIGNAINIIPIPGAMAGINGLIASGLPTERFCFEGFLPTKKKLRDNLLHSLVTEKRTIIFYEAPHRVEKTLKDFAQFFGLNRNLTLARELTKLHEEFWRGTIQEAITFYQNREPKGEFTIIVEGNNQQEELELSETEIKLEMVKLLNQGMSKSEASQHLAKYTNFSRREIYQLTLIDDI
ncbi:MAG: 16S rRNA (cytidine(1402)-2'-O)-methyltransferase [Cyanobacteria bacterium]|nr:16S rRNA (cytidine(1402)-2'-O)-methyltransferase [Cyanobacteria bacterium CG_2015-16_32_12]NCO79222.1 16S rRNA (cytidine(1402)-2'-O)-methyltransferase [Cyanobacteria bacterium CG_2015-22_32_23]NCQ04238.1 16S rRNA (cytidine(1402)-2'-O)-methyltransferase [Cyanobacteria bacterium CG_2015-09_32_10]NCQ41281.1 16S rRNA (cytidine(1402)-2'-O)-methyltransferase [Cyanobacteria bacterium CG_2015-04_32_10]NCS85320.1 16S rRNA (cytidine(1402)-2'-O)-methyltransferase [Cyanobacteria bacterium CG_2015-02_32_